MPTDLNAIVRNVNAFYDMAGKSIIHVGAGGGQLIGYASEAGSVLAVDPDPEGVSRLKAAIRGMGLSDRIRVVEGLFESISETADVVFFEFCLHEIDDPAASLDHARALAPDVLIIDHLPESEWAWCACEEKKAERSWRAVRRCGIAAEMSFAAVQHFGSFDELEQKISVLGEPAIKRIGKYSRRGAIDIEMAYAIALVRGGPI